MSGRVWGTGRGIAIGWEMGETRRKSEEGRNNVIKRLNGDALKKKKAER